MKAAASSVPHLDETDHVSLLAQRLHDSVDAVAGQPEDRVDAPFLENFDKDVGCGLSHRVPLLISLVTQTVHIVSHGCFRFPNKEEPRGKRQRRNNR
jgi:hypothetical protein